MRLVSARPEQSQSPLQIIRAALRAELARVEVCNG